MMKLEISCEHLHCGHTSFVRHQRQCWQVLVQSAREHGVSARDFENTRFGLPGATAACARNICPLVNSVSRPKFSHSTPHHTIPSGSRRCRDFENTPFGLPGAVPAACVRKICPLVVCPAQNFLIAHLTTSFQVALAGAVSVLFREFFCTFPIHLFSECLGPQR
jgi:hypothetical protein